MEYGYSTVADRLHGQRRNGPGGGVRCRRVPSRGLRTLLGPPGQAGSDAELRSRGRSPLTGTYDEAFELCSRACGEFGWYNRNTALNPFTIEGKKTAALEIVASMAPDEPDVVVVPTGDGVILAGLAKGFADLVKGKLLSKMPRLLAVQPEGAAAISRAWQEGVGIDRTGEGRRQHRRQPHRGSTQERYPLSSAYT